ncbi:hypothetical protein [Mangrovibacillus cuniculi]|uniref:Uncharacterized protein n=1 Tax=Mangrovibacillus cuniculi TaxID=2593652 RepID=A0A7S8C9J1_9BACI|nr:hypothetical protein [Mangrovibacillus cuniculi]QPC45909.1 hypothetical protein G8O30_02525 [Mangrovibacillus cuniculi]
MKKIFVCLTVALFFSTLQAKATSWAYELVVWGGNVYSLQDETVEEVGEKIGEVTSYSDMESLGGNFSNAYPVGTAYYSLVGIDKSEAIAVEISKGVFEKATYEHKFKESNFEVFPTTIPMIVWKFLFLMAGLMILLTVWARRK